MRTAFTSMEETSNSSNLASTSFLNFEIVEPKPMHRRTPTTTSSRVPPMLKALGHRGISAKSTPTPSASIRIAACSSAQPTSESTAWRRVHDEGWSRLIAR